MASRLPECGKCGLYKGCQSPKMASTGKGRRKILFVGEAPGETEDQEGKQFTGKTGQYLRKVLQGIGLSLEDAWKTNAIICRPPGNEIQDLHIECCRPNLLRTVRELKPRVIILLGASAVRSLLPAEREADVGSITRWVGWTIPSHERQAWICPTYHPSYILRTGDRAVERAFRNHLRAALRLEDKQIEGEPLDALAKHVERLWSPQEASRRLWDLGKRKGVLAFDYEANCLKPDDPRAKIVAISFCLDGQETISVLWHESLREPVSAILRNPKLLKVASNLKNEERWTRRKLGYRVVSWWWDTMLTAHVLDNRQGICSLKFQSFVRFGIADYAKTVSHYFQSMDKEGFNRIEDCPKDDLLLYNGLDSLLEYRLMELQRKEMGLE